MFYVSGEFFLKLFLMFHRLNLSSGFFDVSFVKVTQYPLMCLCFLMPNTWNFNQYYKFCPLSFFTFLFSLITAVVVGLRCSRDRR